MARRWPQDELWQLAERLADPHRYVLVYQQLHRLGIRTAPQPVRAGGCPSPQARAPCSRILDHLMDPGSIPALAGAPLFWQRPQTSARVRAMLPNAPEPGAHSHPDAATALKAATTGDPSPAVRQEGVVACARRRDLPPGHPINEPVTPVFKLGRRSPASCR